MFRVLNFAKLRGISVIIWDIDGTITDPNGEINDEVAAKIIQLGSHGIYHIFITGRDAAWITRKVIEPMKKFYGFSQIHDNMLFFAEVGCVMLTVDARGGVIKKIHPAVEDHPLAKQESEIRDKLKEHTYNPKKLDRYELGNPFNQTEFSLIYDADRVAWLVPKDPPKPKFDQHVWSIYKEVFGTFENLRDPEGKPMYFDQTQWAEKLQKIIKDEGFEKDIDVEIVATALNIVPKLDGVRLGKSWAAGMALLNLCQEKLGGHFSLDEIINKSIAFGDGRGDFDFTIPYFEADIAQRLERKEIHLVFVGDDEDLPSDKNLLNNMIITATGGGDLVFATKKQVIELQQIKGAKVVSAVLDFLHEWGYFRSF